MGKFSKCKKLSPWPKACASCSRSMPRRIRTCSSPSRLSRRRRTSSGLRSPPLVMLFTSVAFIARNASVAGACFAGRGQRITPPLPFGGSVKKEVVGGHAFPVDASKIGANAHRRRGVHKVEDLDRTSSRAVAEYLSVLDAGSAFGHSLRLETRTQSTPTVRDFLRSVVRTRVLRACRGKGL